MNIKKMIPFLEDEELAALAEKIAESPDGTYQGVTFKDLLPFLDEEDVDKVMVALYAKGKDITCCYPFASDEGLSELVDEIVKGEKSDLNLRALIPFLEDEDISKLSQKVIENGGSFGGLSYQNLIPLMDDDDVDKAFLDMLVRHDPKAKDYAPFVSDEGYHQLVKLFKEGKITDEEIDTYYSYMDEDDVREIFKAALNR
jgi:hypothetical protein